MTGSSRSQLITFKVTFDKVDDNRNHALSDAITVYSRRETVAKLRSKDALIEFLKTELPHIQELEAFNDYIQFTRKSKKHKDFVPLKSEDDFKALARSLKVKNHVKLNVQVEPKRKLFDTESKYNLAQRTEKDLKQKITEDISKFGDALIEMAWEHFKELFGNSHDLSTGVMDKKPLLTKDNECKTSQHNLDAGHDVEKNDNQVIHSNICCDQCSPIEFNPLKGIRYSCLVCDNYDLCSNCEAKQQSEQLSYGNHSYEHPMVKIPRPTQFFTSNAFGLKGAKPDCNYSTTQGYTATGFGASAGANTGAGCWHNNRSIIEDIVYDIPLSQCTNDTRETLTEWLSMKGIDGFMKEVDLHLGKSQRYDEIMNLLNDTGFGNAESRHDFVVDLIRGILKTENNNDDNHNENHGNIDGADDVDLINNIKDEDNDVLYTEKEQLLLENGNNTDASTDGDERVTYATKETQTRRSTLVARFSTVGIMGGKVVLQLINKSDQVVNGGNLKFEFGHDMQRKLTFVKNASDIKPGQVKFYKLGKIPEEYGIENSTFNIITPTLKLEGKFQWQNDIELSVVSRDHDDNNNIAEGFNVVDRDSPPLEDENTTGFVHLERKSNLLFQLVVLNFSGSAISGEDLSISVFNANSLLILKVAVFNEHGISSGKTSKFNLPLQISELVYPITAVLTNKTQVASCTIEEETTEGRLLIFSKEIAAGKTSSVFSSREVKALDALLNIGSMQKSVSGTTDWQSQTASFHSIVLPSLPRESSTSTESISSGDAQLEPMDDKDEEFGENYDLLDSDIESPDSDFEVLSMHSTDS